MIEILRIINGINMRQNIIESLSFSINKSHIMANELTKSYFMTFTNPMTNIKYLTIKVINDDIFNDITNDTALIIPVESSPNNQFIISDIMGNLSELKKKIGEPANFLSKNDLSKLDNHCISLMNNGYHVIYAKFVKTVGINYISNITNFFKLIESSTNTHDYTNFRMIFDADILKSIGLFIFNSISDVFKKQQKHIEIDIYEKDWNKFTQISDLMKANNFLDS